MCLMRTLNEAIKGATVCTRSVQELLVSSEAIFLVNIIVSYLLWLWTLVDSNLSRFAMNHTTAVVQTEAFSNLDDGTLKDFIVRAAKYGAFRHWLLQRLIYDWTFCSKRFLKRNINRSCLGLFSSSDQFILGLHLSTSDDAFRYGDPHIDYSF